MFDHVIEGDILVIGSGIAGSFAAIRGLESGKKVIIVNKGKMCWSGASAAIGGASTAICFPEDDKALWRKTLIEISDYAADQHWVEDYINNSFAQIEHINDITHKHGLDGFPKGKDGTYWRITSPKTPVSTVVCNMYDILEAFAKELRQRGASCHERIMITHLIVENGQAMGAAGFNYRSGESYLFCANVVVMAAGSCTYKIDTYDNCGEVFSMAYAAGATMMSFDRAGVIVRPKNVMRAGVLDNVPVFGLPGIMGGRCYNSENKDLLDIMTDEELAAGRLGVDAAMRREMAAGRGPIYEDCSQLPEETKTLLFSLKRANCKRVMVEYGLDPMKEKIPMHPEHLEQTFVPDVCNRMGGIDIDTNGESTIKGLFVVGDASAPKACAQHPFPGVELGWAIFSGGRIGTYAATFCDRYAKPNPETCRKLGQTAIMELLSALNQHGPLSPDDLKEAIINTLIPYDVNHCDESAMEQCLARLHDIEHNNVPQLGVNSFYELREYIEAKSMLWVAMMLVESEKYRKESRLGVHRKDYPMMDNVNWLKWIKFVKQDGKEHFFTEDITDPYFPVPREIKLNTRHRV